MLDTPSPQNALAGCETWPDRTYLIISPDGAGNPVIRPAASADEEASFNAQSLAEAKRWLALGPKYLLLPCHLVWNKKNRKIDKPPGTGLGGIYNATNNPFELERMWNACRHPAAIGLHTKHILALDFDIGDEAQAWCTAHPEIIASTWGQHTSSRGVHSLYWQPSVPIKNAQGKPVKNIDIRGDDGYIVLWAAHGFAHIGADTVEHCPAWLETLLRSERSAKSRDVITAKVVSARLMAERANMIDQIKNDARFLAREDWVKMAAAIWASFAGDLGLGSL